jgi:hypothetical protein
MRAFACGALVASALVSGAAPARAQNSSYVEHKTADGQSVAFDDDPMGAVVGGPTGAQITGPHVARHFNLMRPRRTFVPELLKSVEKM